MTYYLNLDWDCGFPEAVLRVVNLKRARRKYLTGLRILQTGKGYHVYTKHHVKSLDELLIIQAGLGDDVERCIHNHRRQTNRLFYEKWNNGVVVSRERRTFLSWILERFYYGEVGLSAIWGVLQWAKNAHRRDKLCRISRNERRRLEVL